jgi:hypothetical protein
VFGAHTAHEIDAAFEAIAREQAGALLVLSDPFFTSSVTQITTNQGCHSCGLPIA